MTQARIVLLGVALLLPSSLWADEDYTAKSGRIEFTVGANLPFVEVTGASSKISGGGEANVSGDIATVRELHFEVEPTSFKTGIKRRDQHLYDQVFRAADGSMPKIELHADQFRARLNAQTSTWEGDLQGRLRMRGVERPVSFHASGKKMGEAAVISATGVIRTSTFGVKPITNAGITVKDEVRITVSDLLLKP